jgi:hypothetical protein
MATATDPFDPEQRLYRVKHETENLYLSYWYGIKDHATGEIIEFDIRDMLANEMSSEQVEHYIGTASRESAQTFVSNYVKSQTPANIIQRAKYQQEARNNQTELF